MTPEHSGKNCYQFEPFLDDYLRGELARDAAQRLAAHLESCSECREALDDLRISAKLVNAAFEQASDPGPGFVRKVMAQIDRAEGWVQGQRAFWRPFEAVAWRMAFSAALALAFLFAYGFRNGPIVTSEEPPAVLVPQTDAFAQPLPFSPSISNSNEVLMAIAERRHEQQ